MFHKLCHRAFTAHHMEHVPIGDVVVQCHRHDGVVEFGESFPSGHLAIVALSHIGGLIGTALYMIAALAFVRYLNEKLDQCSDKWGRRFLKLFIVGLYWGCMVFVYFHLACGTLIHTYNVIFEAVGGDTARAVSAWNRAYRVQAVPYWASFVVLELATTVGWIAIIWKGVLPLKKRWALAAPMLIAGIGFLLELILPLPFNGFASGFESFGWIVMFLGGIRAIRKEERKDDR